MSRTILKIIFFKKFSGDNVYISSCHVMTLRPCNLIAKRWLLKYYTMVKDL